MASQLHPKWEGVWEISGKNHTNSEKMIILFDIHNKLTHITIASTLNTFNLVCGSQSNLEAHWIFNVEGYYIGILNHIHFNIISWYDTKKNCKPIAWIRTNINPKLYLTQCKLQINRQHNLNNTYQSAQQQIQPSTVHHQITSNCYPNNVKQYPNQNTSNHYNINNNNYSQTQSHSTNAIHKHQYYYQQPTYPNQNQRMVPLINNNYNTSIPINYTHYNNNIQYKQNYIQHNNNINRINHTTISTIQPVHQQNTNHTSALVGGVHQNNITNSSQYNKVNRNLIQTYYESKNNNYQKQKPIEIFTTYITKEETDKIMNETKDYPFKVLYIGEINISWFNPSVAYVKIDSLKYDIQINGISDRNRAYNGDTVIVSLYPEIEWISAINQTLIDFENKLNERDNIEIHNNEKKMECDDINENETKSDQITQKKTIKKTKKNGHELNDKESVTAYDKYKLYKINKDSNEFKWSNQQHILNKIPRGKVLGIYNTNQESITNITGFLIPMHIGKYGYINRHYALFAPLDQRYPKAWISFNELSNEIQILFNKYEKEEIKLMKEKNDGMKFGLLIQKRNNIFKNELNVIFLNVKYDKKWIKINNHSTCNPICYFKSLLGKRGTIDVETNIILNKNNILWRAKFNENIENIVKNMKITKEDYKNRKDCRALRTFSIDPTSAKDFDDALSINELIGETDKNGNKLYEIGIHIADVTHFVEPNSIIDIEAQKRGTSIYLVDRCIPMLPHYLSQNLCSLNPNEDRLTYSIFVILNQNGDIIYRNNKSPWFGKTIIKSKARLNYETAHYMLSYDTDNNSDVKLDDCCVISADVNIKELINDIKLFWSIGKLMREKRFNLGSFKFHKPNIRFRLDKNNENKVLVFGPEINLLSNYLVEEMMLLANKLVAKRLINIIKSHTLLRIHPKPTDDKTLKLKLICRSQELNLQYDNLNESFMKMNNKLYNGISAEQIINVLLAKTMNKAEYIIVENTSKEEWTHFGLHFDVYTHFTSPIRRYADILVHRLLSYTVYNNTVLPCIKTMKKQCKICNERNEAARIAQRDSQYINLCLVLMNKPIIVDAVIVDMGTKSFIIVIPGLGLDILCNINELKQQSNKQINKICILFKLPDSKLVIKWNNNEKYEEETYKLFDKIRIKVSSILQTQIKLTVSIINPINRKYCNVANKNVICDDNDSKENDNNNDNDTISPVVMTLEAQRSIGTSDYFIANYD